MDAPVAFQVLLKQKGYSSEAIKEIWKWYDFSERKGVNFRKKEMLWESCINLE